MEAKTEVERRIARLAARDRLMRHLGVECVDGGPGRAAVSLAIRDDHLNFNGTCHGGAIFALADSAFGLASNSQGVIAAAIDAHITYQVAVKPGDMLTATAVEVSRSRKLGVYRVDVTRQDGALVSSFTGTVYVTERANEGADASRPR
jgi:phenylacetic acid degradation protein PaaD